MADIFLENVTKIFGKKLIAVKDLFLKIKDKEIVAILGPSGCGKTTTLRMIAGLEKPTKGRIYIGGEDVTDLPPKDRNVGMVFQFYAIYPGKTVYENIAFPLKCRGVSRTEIDKRVKAIAEHLEILSILDKEAMLCHPAEKQLTALARALVIDPEVLLLDEPLTILDADHRELMRVKLKQLLKEEKITCIYVTHDQKEAMSLGDRLAVMKDGILQQVGTPDELLTKPYNRFVAGFVGTPPMNFLEGKLTKINDKLCVDFGFGFLKLENENIAERVQHKIRIGEKLEIGVRPRDVILNMDEREIKYTLVGRVNFIEYLGDHMLVEIKLAPEAKIVCQIPPIDIKIGSVVRLSLPEEKCHFFNDDGENVLATSGDEKW